MGVIITLTTDFGLTDGYVAAMKGTALGINPDVTLVDICHTIQPRNIPQAAFILSTVHEYFPPRTVHLVVVDPGVGTERLAVILRTPYADFVAPDNGILSYIIRRYCPGPPLESRYRLSSSSGIEAYAVTKPEYWRSPVGPTFHGRDIFAPVAAHLSLGRHPADFGEPLSDLGVLPASVPDRLQDGTLVGHVIHIDTFGNLITDFRSDDLPESPELSLEVAGHIITGLSLTYGTGEELIALIGSSDYLEIALPGDDASVFLGASTGDEVIIRQILH